ncbi:MAG: TonB-dependent receptor [Pseudomonadota bacterium]
MGAVALAAFPAMAQVDTIVVTAEKKEENVQDVGLSVQAFAEDGLNQGGITDVSRLELLVSGVNFAFVGNDAKFNVRGANSTNTFADNASIVGTYVDGVYKLRASQQSRRFFDVQRLEFLKGPQGTLYGRNTFAGALNIYNNTVDLEGYSAGFNASYERFNTSRVDGYLNAPLSDTFGIRVAGFVDNSDGYIDNIAGPDLGALNDTGVRVTALWEPTETFEATLRYSYIQEKGREAGLFGYTFLCRNVTPSGHTDPLGSQQDCANPLPGSGGFPSADELGPYEVAQDFVPRADTVEQVISLEMVADLGPVVAKSITSYTDFGNNLGFDFDFSPQPFQAGGFNEDAEYFTQELQFSSNYDSRLQWTAGAYYSYDETDFNFFIYNQREAAGRGADVPVLDNTGAPLLDGTGAPVSLPLLTATPLLSNDPVLGGFFADNSPLETNYFGVYAQGTFDLTDRFRVIGGLRWDSESKELVGGGSNFTGDTDGDGIAEPPVVSVNPGGPFGGLLPQEDIGAVFGFFAFDDDADDAIRTDFDAQQDLTWRGGLEYDLNDNALLYFTSSTGFLSGAARNNGTITDPLTSRVFEGGIKSILFDGQLKFNLAGHFTQYRNLLRQVQAEQVLDDGTVIVITNSDNGGRFRAYGLELESLWVPNDQLQIGINASYLNAEFAGEFIQGNPYQLFNGQLTPNGIDVDGEATPWSPDFTASIFGSYTFDLGDKGTLTPYVQFYYSDGYNTSNLLSIDANQQQDSFTKTDFRLTWDAPDSWGNYSVEAFIENIEDEAVLARGNNNSSDIVQTGFLYPRNFGLRVRADF